MRIRDHQYLRVTARNKMGAARRTGGYGGTWTSTIWLPLAKPNILRKNLACTKSFMEEILKSSGHTKKKSGGGYLVRDVPVAAVLDYLDAYQFAGRDDTGSSGLDADDLRAYIRRVSARGELSAWNVGIVSPMDEARPGENIGGLEVKRVVRNRRKAENGFRLGALTNPQNLRMDREDVNERLFADGVPIKPLLLIYHVAKDSSPRKGEQEEALFAGLQDKVDVVGLAFVFPKSDAESNGYVVQEL